MRIQTEEILCLLDGCVLHRVHRAGAISVLSFACAETGRVVFGLHLQCSWRLRQGAKILLGWSDISLPASFVCDVDDDWEAAIQTRFDEQAAKVSALPSLAAKLERVDINGGFCLRLGSNVLLEVFPNCSRREEFWRLLALETGEHFVVFEELVGKG